MAEYVARKVAYYAEREGEPDMFDKEGNYEYIGKRRKDGTFPLEKIEENEDSKRI